MDWLCDLEYVRDFVLCRGSKCVRGLLVADQLNRIVGSVLLLLLTSCASPAARVARGGTKSTARARWDRRVSECWSLRAAERSAPQRRSLGGRGAQNVR